MCTDSTRKQTYQCAQYKQHNTNTQECMFFFFPFENKMKFCCFPCSSTPKDLPIGVSITTTRLMLTKLA